MLNGLNCTARRKGPSVHQKVQMGHNLSAIDAILSAMKRTIVIALAIFTFALSTTRAQEPVKTIAERLGYPRDAKLLIVHADDLGMAHSVNIATMKALETGLVNSGSIMVPCPWLSEIATYARANPKADLGLHLTLTSEWTSFRWGPVMSKNRVSYLID